MATTPYKFGRENTKGAQWALWNGTGIVAQAIRETFGPADMTDNTNTTGYYDFKTELPADCIVLGWKATAGVAWDSDTTATVQVGIAGTLDLYSSTTTGSIATAATVGSIVKTTGVYFQEAAATARVTITGGSDFTAFVTAGTPRLTVTIYYIPCP